MINITADFSSSSIKRLKPLHGVNSGPMTKAFTYDARPFFEEAGFPFARLHDVEYPYGSGEFVDIPCIFKNFDADETKEENYSFGLTDEYLKACIEVGSEPLFRLGVSIEHAPVKMHIFPPKDFAKWARICEHIIRHYTEGWANGFNWNIRYWEIWNEADGGNNMWIGTPEQYYEFYCVSALHLKKQFPNIYIGGGAFCTSYNPFTEGFLKYISGKSEEIPLDFYSWHCYCTNALTVIDMAKKADELLEKYGYSNAESILDEWNYMHDWNNQADSYPILKNHIGASFCAEIMCAAQTKTNIAVATYFEADVVKEWCGIFDVDKMSIGVKKATVKPLKPFYAFKAFGELYRMGNEINVACNSDEIYSCAATDGNKFGLMATNHNNEEKELRFDIKGIKPTTVEVRMTDQEHTFEKIFALDNAEKACFSIVMKPHSFVYISNR